MTQTTFGEAHTLMYASETDRINGQEVRTQECRCGVMFVGSGKTQTDALLDIASQHGHHYSVYLAKEAA